MTTFHLDDTVGAIVRTRSDLSRFFEQSQVDYCCGGQKTLAEACAKRGIDPHSFLADLTSWSATVPTIEVDFASLTLTELADHIERIHHAYLHNELPRLAKMAAKVAAVHGDREPRLLQIRDIFCAQSAELSRYLTKEEQVLFPMIRQLEASDTPPSFHCGTIANPIRRMEFEHEEAGEALRQLRQLSNDYTPPDWACNTYRAFFDALRTFEQDMHQHILDILPPINRGIPKNCFLSFLLPSLTGFSLTASTL